MTTTQTIDFASEPARVNGGAWLVWRNEQRSS